VRAYATNSQGTGYGDEENFITEIESGNTVTDYDGNVYQTVQIGSQVWMAENLKVTHYADGSAIPLVESNSAWDYLGYSDKAYCWYDNSTANRDSYGGLYTWATVMDGAVSSTTNPSGVQGVCPDGWHLPSDPEWKQLEMHLGMSQAESDGIGYRGTDEGGKLKEAGTTHWSSPNTGATNASDFTALPGAARMYTGSFTGVGDIALFWSTTESDGSRAWIRSLANHRAEVTRFCSVRSGGCSVRCVGN